MSAARKQIVTKINEAFARNDVEAFLAFCIDDVEWTMVGEKTVTGKAAIRAWMTSGPSEPPLFTTDAVIAEGDHVVATGYMTMTESGAVVPYSYCDVWTFRGDQVASLKAYVLKTA